MQNLSTRYHYLFELLDPKHSSNKQFRVTSRQKLCIEIIYVVLQTPMRSFYTSVEKNHLYNNTKRSMTKFEVHMKHLKVLVK